MSTLETVNPIEKLLVRPNPTPILPGIYAPAYERPSESFRFQRIQGIGRLLASYGSLANSGIPVSV